VKTKTYSSILGAAVSLAVASASICAATISGPETNPNPATNKQGSGNGVSVTSGTVITPNKDVIHAMLGTPSVSPNPVVVGAKVKFTLTLGNNPNGCSALLTSGAGGPGENIFFKKSVTSVEIDKVYQAIGTYDVAIKGQGTQTNSGGLITNWPACLGSQSTKVHVIAGN